MEIGRSAHSAAAAMPQTKRGALNNPWLRACKEASEAYRAIKRAKIAEVAVATEVEQEAEARSEPEPPSEKVGRASVKAA